MSWNPFSRSSLPKRSILVEKDFDKDVKRLNELETANKQLQKDVRKYIEALVECPKTETQLASELATNEIFLHDPDLKQYVARWRDGAQRLEKDADHSVRDVQKAIEEPIKRYNTVMLEMNSALKKRDQLLQEYSHAQTKLEKYQKQSKANPNKLQAAQGGFNEAKRAFESKHGGLTRDLHCVDTAREQNFNPCVPLIADQQAKYFHECQQLHGELAKCLSAGTESADSLDAILRDIRALTLVVDEEQ